MDFKEISRHRIARFADCALRGRSFPCLRIRLIGPGHGRDSGSGVKGKKRVKRVYSEINNVNNSENAVAIEPPAGDKWSKRSLFDQERSGQDFREANRARGGCDAARGRP